MRPAARLAAAIEVLEAWQISNASLDHTLTAWGRAHRFAGSKDRAAISDRVYAVLRRRAECAWVTGADTPRGWVLGSLMLDDDLDAAAIEALFASAPHAPAPLSDDERAALGRKAQSPPWIAGNYPEWLHDELARGLGPALPAEMAAMASRAPLDLRVNSLKATPEGAVAALTAEGIAAETFPLAPGALRLLPRTPVAKSQAYAAGLVEVQDSGAQIAAKIACARPGEMVIDLAAGAGGKALAFAADMDNRGRILACDADAARLARLAPRADRAGAEGIESHVVAADMDVARDPVLAPLQGQADLVVLDVPCSGSGTWRRHPDQKWRLTPEDLHRLKDVQAHLLDQGARLVRPGGRLVYVTCSLLRCENEDAVAAFSVRAPEFRRVLARDSLATAGLAAISCSDGAMAVCLSPRSAGTDGFFIAVLAK